MVTVGKLLLQIAGLDDIDESEIDELPDPGEAQ